MILGTKQKQEIDRKGKLIANLVNQSGLLSVPVMFEIIDNPGGQFIIANFYLNEETYSRGQYYIEPDGLYKGSLVANGAGVNSNMGNRSGMFMFHLQLLLVMTSGARIFNLNNYTDEPARAAQGIYSLLSVNTTLGTHGTPRPEFTGKSLSDKLHLSEGEMRLVVDASSMTKWTSKMKELPSKVEGKGDPWNPNVEKNMNKFLGSVSQYGMYGGRKSKTKPKKKTLKKKHRKFSKKNTKKSRKKRKKSRKLKAKTKM